MPKWWPWGRSEDPHEAKRPEPEPEPAAPRREWRHVPPVQRSVGPAEPVARFAGFTEQLTTSQNPGLTGALPLLSTGHDEPLSILDLGQGSSPATRPKTAPTSTPRTWAPSPAALQRALGGTTTPVQRAPESAVPEPTAPVRRLYSVAPLPDARPAGSLLAAPSPDDRRPLAVAAPDTATASGTPRDAGPAPAPAIQRSLEIADGATEPPPAARNQAIETAATPISLPVTGPAPVTTAPHPPTVTTPAPPAIQRSLAGVEPPRPRELPAVRAAAADSPDPPRPKGGTTAPLPVLRTIDSLATVQRAADAGTEPSTPTSLGDPAPRLTAVQVEAPVCKAPAQVPAGPLAALPVLRAVDTAQPDSAQPDSAPKVFRDSALSTADVRPAHTPPPAMHPPAPSVQRIPVVDAEPTPQRLPAVDAGPSPSRAPARSVPNWPSSPALSVENAPATTTPTLGPRHGGATAVPTVPTSSMASTTAQRSLALPVVQRAADAGDPAAALAPDQPAARGRIQILPPVRRSETPTASDNPARSVLSESPRPLGLQRMFAQQGFGPSDRSAPEDRGSAAVLAPSAASYDRATNTITFAPPSIQRTTETSPPPAEPTPAPSAVSAPAAPHPETRTDDIEDLVDRIYDPLAARLRAELWLDRERAGALMDLGR
ncbi:hypothetical protein JDV09_11735 [Mycobacterium sp. Y57]|uniref:hypothetical protein n=1 Tax=Mycolicibacterium xanthum TaxID=2796469 RepID=UPI001C8626D2|nr:hypothetical protein [Mycolicibacterium xanthum]MBX7432770.1 hypothetical protein [Mycolicibacterium xanthum]